MCARAGAHMIKFEKYEHSAFTGKKIINLDKKQRFYKNMKMPMKSEKKHPVYVRAWYELSTFPEKKINVVAWLDQFLAQLVPSFPYIPS